MNSEVKQTNQRFMDAVFLGLICYIASRIAVYFLIEPQGMAPFWFSNGVVLAVLLRRSKRDWPLLLGAALCGFLANMFFTGFPLYPDFVYGVGNTIEPLIAALIITKFLPRFELTNLRALKILIFSSAFAAALIATLAWSVGPINWALWWIDDWLGMLIVTPILLVFWPISRRYMRFSRPNGRQITEMVTLLSCMVLTTIILVSQLGNSASFLYPYAPLPFLLWATLRSKLRAQQLRVF